MTTPVLVGETLTIANVVAVARGAAEATLSDLGRSAMTRANAVVASKLASDGPATYGVNTGFGALAEVRVATEDLATLQLNLVRSHAAGVGEPLADEVVRAMMLLRAQVLALGHSGARPHVVELILSALNAGVVPVVPQQGSVGACGDLAPLAHMALVWIGEGRARYRGEVLPGGEALARAGLEPLVLEPKEGLSLINGTQGMLAIGVLALERAETLLDAADVAGAMSLEALLGSPRPFDDAIIAARPHPGAKASAARLRALLANSRVVDSHADCSEVQDAYSLRCMPQVHGAARDAVRYARSVLEVEINSVTDNPLVLADGRVQSGGNFHGQPVAQALDVMKIGLVDLASISERRVAQLVDPHLNRGLPAFLAASSGLHSGFMMAQVTAASLVSEAKSLAYPASVDSIPTSADREDHVSMGMTAARLLELVMGCCLRVLAVETLVAAHGVDLRGLRPGDGVAAAHAKLRGVAPFVEGDRVLGDELEEIAAWLARGGFGDG